MSHDLLGFIKGPDDQNISDDDLAFVTVQLGREPRGLEAIQVRRDNGDPAVIRVSSLVDDKPFPTLFWLVDPQLNYRIDGLEASGMISRLQHKIDASETVRSRLAAEHREYIQLRESHMTAKVREVLLSNGYWESLSQKGIGGISNFQRVRCLHTFYAAHLNSANQIGRLLEASFMDCE